MTVTMEHIATGKTIEDAIGAGCTALGLDRDSVSVEVLQTPSRGFLFGLGAQDAKVRLTYEVQAPDPKPQPRERPAPAPKREPVQNERPAPRPQPAGQGPAPKREPAQRPASTQRPEATQKLETAQSFEPAPKPERSAGQPPKRQPEQPRGEGAAQGADAQPPRGPSRQPSGDQQPRGERRPEPRTPKPDQASPALPFEPVSGTRAEAFLGEIFTLLELPVSMAASSDGTLLRISLSGDNMGLLIGRRGETLDALQYLTGLVAGHGDERFSKVSLDIENYRAKREEALVTLASRVAEKVCRLQKSVTLEPMNPYERRIIHAALQDVEGVETGSIGHEPTRRVVVSPAGSGGPRSSEGPGNPRNRKRRRKPAGPRPTPEEAGQSGEPAQAETPVLSQPQERQ